jgi:hypothetical protein
MITQWDLMRIVDAQWPGIKNRKKYMKRENSAIAKCDKIPSPVLKLIRLSIYLTSLIELKKYQVFLSLHYLTFID